MSFTLLLDLDNTLLENDLGRFLPAYFDGILKFIPSKFPFETVLEKFHLAASAMIANLDPSVTLRDAFEAHFLPAIDLEKEVWVGSFEQFLAQGYPQLEEFTAEITGAYGLVESALNRDYRLVIATNPVFPQAAIQQRLEWAGLGRLAGSFNLVTSSENFHFSKPNPAYYGEIMAQTGWKNQPTIMVGDDPTNDILSASRLGLPTFWTPSPAGTLVDQPELAGFPRGGLEEFLPWLDSQDPRDLDPDLSSIDSIIGTLRSTPAALHSMLGDLSPPDWKFRKTPDEWNFREISCHLRDVEIQVNRKRVDLILGENNPFIPGVDTDNWVRTRNYNLERGRVAFNSFVHNRSRLLEIITKIDPKDWSRPARHAIFGPTRFQELLGFMAEHDRIHIRQVWEILEVIKKQV